MWCWANQVWADVEKKSQVHVSLHAWIGAHFGQEPCLVNSVTTHRYIKYLGLDGEQATSPASQSLQNSLGGNSIGLENCPESKWQAASQASQHVAEGQVSTRASLGNNWKFEKNWRPCLWATTENLSDKNPSSECQYSCSRMQGMYEWLVVMGN